MSSPPFVSSKSRAYLAPKLPLAAVWLWPTAVHRPVSSDSAVAAWRHNEQSIVEPRPASSSKRDKGRQVRRIGVVVGLRDLEVFLVIAESIRDRYRQVAPARLNLAANRKALRRARRRINEFHLFSIARPVFRASAKQSIASDRKWPFRAGRRPGLPGAFASSE